MSLATMMESAATVKRPRVGKGATGGTTTPSFRTIIEDAPCSVQPAGANVVLMYAQREAQVTARIYFLEDVGAETNDILEVTNDNSDVVSKFRVEGTSTGLFGRLQSPFFVDCSELK